MLFSHLAQDSLWISDADLGTQPNISTNTFLPIFQHVPQARLAGLDSSEAMIDAARKRMPNIDFQIADIAQWQDAARYSLIVANAVLQWLPDHAKLFPSLLGSLEPNGTLAVQMPDNLEEPAHILMREVASDKRWSDRLSQAMTARAPRQPPSFYYKVLSPIAQTVDIWQTTYFHVLENTESIVEWFKGSGLRPFLDPLTESERSSFLDIYRLKINGAYPQQADGSVLLSFPRTFIIAKLA